MSEASMEINFGDKHLDHLDILEPIGRSKTSLRLKYEAETRVFLTKFGGLESIRKSLGFSQRKMSQILMVDPSAWSRWIKDETKVPPHIVRSLEWLLQLEEKNPELVRVLNAGLMSSGGGGSKVLEAQQKTLTERISQLEGEIEGLKRRKLAEISKIMTILIGLFALALLLILVK